jgi:GT2 family glycosyltransferase
MTNRKIKASKKTENSKIVFSVIIPVKEINDYIRESVPKILEMYYQNYEIIILPNELPAYTEDLLKNKKIKILSTGKVSPAVKRDIGAKHSRGEYLAFIDDDAYPAKDWLDIAIKALEKNKISAVCGPAVTPEDDSFFQKASGLFFETIFGGGGLDYRYKPAKKDFFVEDYPSVNFIVSKKSFFSVGGFDNEFWPGEDTKFCLDLVKNGHKILYLKDLIVFHHRRETLKAHLKQIFGYGKHRGYFAKKFPQTSFRITYFMPSIFLLGNILLLILSFINCNFVLIWLLLLIFYFILIFADSFKVAGNFKLGLLTGLITFFSHLTYGYGFIIGLLSRRFKSRLR